VKWGEAKVESSRVRVGSVGFAPHKLVFFRSAEVSSPPCVVTLVQDIRQSAIRLLNPSSQCLAWKGQRWRGSVGWVEGAGKKG